MTAGGSFNGGRLPSIADALEALDIAVSIDVPTNYELLISDFFADDRINASSDFLILKNVVGL